MFYITNIKNQIKMLNLPPLIRIKKKTTNEKKTI